jgi:hypothetical protein
MATEKSFFCVASGKVLRHDHKELPAGTVVMLDLDTGASLKHIVFPCDSTGAPVELEDSTLAASLARHRVHERETILANEKARLEAALQRVNTAIAEQQLEAQAEIERKALGHQHGHPHTETKSKT